MGEVKGISDVRIDGQEPDVRVHRSISAAKQYVLSLRDMNNQSRKSNQQHGVRFEVDLTRVGQKPSIGYVYPKR